jgi:hypothetical protein
MNKVQCIAGCIKSETLVIIEKRAIQMAKCVIYVRNNIITAINTINNLHKLRI